MHPTPPRRHTFRAHGQTSSQADGRLILTDVTGPWNKELVDEWGRAAYALVKPMGPHVGIALIHGSMLCTPDALAEMRRSAKYAATSLQCVGHAIVADKTVDGRDLVDISFIRAYEGVLPLGIFYTLAEARAWALALLAEQGY